MTMQLIIRIIVAAFGGFIFQKLKLVSSLLLNGKMLEVQEGKSDLAFGFDFVLQIRYSYGFD